MISRLVLAGNVQVNALGSEHTSLRSLNKKDTWSLKKSYDKPKQFIKKQRYHYANNNPYVKSHGFASSNVCMQDLDNKEGWVPKNWLFWIVMLGKILESPLHCQEFKPVNPKGSQPLIFVRSSDDEVEAPILWSPDVKNRIIGKKPWCWKDWVQEEKRGSENEMVGWHQWFIQCMFEQNSGDN